MENISRRQFDRLFPVAELVPELCHHDALGGIETWGDWFRLPDGRFLQAWGNSRPERGWRLWEAGELRDYYAEDVIEAVDA